MKRLIDFCRDFLKYRSMRFLQKFSKTLSTHLMGTETYRHSGCRHLSEKSGPVVFLGADFSNYQLLSSTERGWKLSMQLPQLSMQLHQHLTKKIPFFRNPFHESLLSET